MRFGRHPYVWALMVGCSLSLAGCSSLSKGQADLDVGMKERGIASWYGDDFHGWVTANGEFYDMYALTGAHRTLPLGTVVRVTNVVNGRHVTVRINDRGPYVKGRILDLSFKAAQELHMVHDGISAVYLEVIGHQGLESLAADHQTLKVRRSTMAESSPVDMGHHPARILNKPIPKVSRADRHVRQVPGDVLRERRLRQAGDIVTAGRRADVVAALEIA